MNTKALKAQISKNIAIDSTVDGCLEWTGETDRLYGQAVMVCEDEKVPVIRIVWMLHHGPIPNGMKVNRKCDTHACVNIDHLELLPLRPAKAR